MEKELQESMDPKTDLTEHMTSPEFIASLPGADRLILDPITFMGRKSTIEAEAEK